MPTISIEILCVGADSVLLPVTEAIGVDSSSPPLSDRSPSLWQEDMNKRTGSLIHLFDVEFVGRHRRWAYEIISEKDWREFRFKKTVWPEVKKVMKGLITQSPRQEIVFYSDAQWSLEPKLFDDTSLDDFELLHRNSYIRMNTAYIIRSV